MNLSVESRVKAHISTPYIDADGRGVEGAYAADYADCMKSPDDFREIQLGGGKDDALLKELEERCAALVERSKQFHNAILEREAERCKQRASEASQLGAHVQMLRAAQIEVERAEDSAKLDQAYHKRLESELDMDRYLRLLVKSNEAKLRDKEESVTERHARLREKAKLAREAQQLALHDEQRRADHLNAIQEKILVKLAREHEEREAEEIHRQMRDEYASIVKQRKRDAELALKEQEIRMAQEVDSLSWAQLRDKAVDAAQHAANELAEKNRTLAQIVMAENEAKEAQLYAEMKELQSRYESKALELQKEIKSKYKVGSYLEHLMKAAKGTAEREKKMFHGLTLLQNATMKPSQLTPVTAPQYTGPATKSIAVLTTISEPIKKKK